MNKNQKVAMAEKNLAVKDVGFLLNLHPAYLSGVFSGRYRSLAARKRICEILNKPESYLWPESHINGPY